MARSLLVLALLALPAFAAAPSFSDVVKRFPPKALPLDPSKLAETPPLPDAEVPVLGFVGRAEKGFGPLRHWSSEPEGGTTERLVPLARLERGELVVLVLRDATEFSSGQYQGDFLLTYSSKGALLDGAELASLATSDGNRAQTTATLAADGTFVQREERRIAMDDDGLPPNLELVAVAEKKHRLLPSGKFELGAPKFLSEAGIFIDPKSREELRVVGEAIFYRGNGIKPFQRLLRDGSAVRFKAGGKPYVLSWDEPRASITCKNPDGTKQTFTRDW